jgi:hypothetical protein
MDAFECRTNHLGYRQYYDEHGDERCPACGGLYVNEGQGSIHPKCVDVLDLNDVEDQEEEP